MFGTICEISQV